MKYTILVLLLTVCNFSFAQSDNPTIKKSVVKINDFVPTGWKLIAETKGDLNKDGLADVALIIENTNPKNFISNAGKLGGDTLNTNPRYLLVAFKKANGFYDLVAQNKTFIPAPNSYDSPCLEDPFAENGSIEIKKGLLSIHFQHFYSCGAWEIYNFDYIFRFQNQKLALIGYNKSSLHRSTGEETTTTINFSTKKMNYTSGTNAFKNGDKPKTTWKNIKTTRLLELGTIKEDDLRQFD